MTVWAWLKFTFFLWLIRKAFKLAWWLLLAVAARGGLAGHRGGRRRVPRGVAARLAPGPAVPGRRLGAASHRGLAGLPGGPGAGLPGRPRPRPDLGGRLGPADHSAPGRGVRGAGPGHAPGRAGAGRAGVGVAELRRHRRAGGCHGLCPDHLRRPPVEAAGPHRPGPDPRPRRRPPARPAGTGSRSAAPSAPSATRGTRCSPWTRRRCARHMVIVGSTGSREDEPDDPAVGGLVHRHPGGLAGREGRPAAAGGAGLQGRPRRPQESRTHPPPALRRRRPPGRHLAGRGPAVHLGPAPGRPGGAAVPDDRVRHRRRRLLRRHAVCLRGPGRHRPAAAPRTTPRRSWTGWTPNGSSTRGATAATPARPSRPAPPPGTCATSSCATPPCWTGSARPWTAPAPWPRPTPGTSSWKAPANRAWPRRRRWRSPSWPPAPPPPWTASSARSCWPPMTTPRSPAGCRCRTCTSGAGRWASGCRSRRSPGRDSGPMRMSGTGSRPPPTAASSSCIPRTPNPWSPSRGSGGCWRPRTSSSAARGGMRAPPGSSAPGPPTRTSSAA